MQQMRVQLFTPAGKHPVHPVPLTLERTAFQQSDTRLIRRFTGRRGIVRPITKSVLKSVASQTSGRMYHDDQTL